ncbi:MAG: sugar phosphate nucleotidyltransferase [Bacilli bacterium]
MKKFLYTCKMKNVISIIMGGGRGTRLYPLTKYRCKPAVPLAGKYRLVDIPISNCINSGCDRIYLLSQFNTASLHKHIQQTYKFDSFGKGFVDILAAEQTDSGGSWYQGTADAVRKNMHHFERHGDNCYYLILSGDQLYQMNFESMILAHIASGADITIAAKPMPKSEAPGLGVMKVNGNLEITQFAEKPKDEAVIKSFLIGEDLKRNMHDKRAIIALLQWAYTCSRKKS